MRWNPEAEKAVERVHFFVRNHSLSRERLREILNRVGREALFEEGAKKGETPAEGQEKKKIEKNQHS